MLEALAAGRRTGNGKPRFGHGVLAGDTSRGKKRNEDAVLLLETHLYLLADMDIVRITADDVRGEPHVS